MYLHVHAQSILLSPALMVCVLVASLQTLGTPLLKIVWKHQLQEVKLELNSLPRLAMRPKIPQLLAIQLPTLPTLKSVQLLRTILLLTIQFHQQMPPLPTSQLLMPPLPTSQLLMPPLPTSQLLMPPLSTSQLLMSPLPTSQLLMPPLSTSQSLMSPLLTSPMSPLLMSLLFLIIRQTIRSLYVHQKNHIKA